MTDNKLQSNLCKTITKLREENAELEAKLSKAREALECSLKDYKSIGFPDDYPEPTRLREALAALGVDAIPTNTEVIKEAKRNAFGNVTSALEVEK